MKHTFPEDGTLEEYLDGNKRPEPNGFGIIAEDLDKLHTQRYNNRNRTFESMLFDARNSGLKLIEDPEVREGAAHAIDIAMAVVISEFTAPIVSARWVVSDYIGDYDSTKKEVVEHTRPATVSLKNYWDLVNN